MKFQDFFKVLQKIFCSILFFIPRKALEKTYLVTSFKSKLFNM